MRRPRSMAGRAGRAFPTRAFAGEIRAVLARARQLGMDPADVVDAGEAAGRPEWVGAGEFFEEYLDVLDAEGVLDYAELVHRCRILLAEPEIVTRLRAELEWVFVDEYQDTDPAQVRLLQPSPAMTNVVVVGAPTIPSIPSGGRCAGLLDFRRFRTATPPRPVLALSTTRLFGTAVRRPAGTGAAAGVPRALPPGRSRPSGAAARPGLFPACGGGGFPCSSSGAEAEHIAEILRSAHLRDGLGWDEMAVLVRAGRSMIPGLTRALAAAGVPMEVAGDEIPLAVNPAVRPLLLALQVAARGCAVTPDEGQLLPPRRWVGWTAGRTHGWAGAARGRAGGAGRAVPCPALGRADQPGAARPGPAG